MSAPDLDGKLEDRAASPRSGLLRRRKGILGPWALLALSAVAMVAASVLCILYVDRPLMRLCAGLEGSWVRDVFQVVTFLGMAPAYLLVAAATFAHSRFAAARATDRSRAEELGRRARRAAYLFLVVLAAAVASDGLKIVFGRARPRLLERYDLYGFDYLSLDPDFWSLPSGHAMTIVAVATAAYLLTRRQLPALVAIAVLVCLSRLILVEHYLSDVLMGAYLAFLIALGLRRVLAGRLGDIFPGRTAPSQGAR